MVHNKALSKPMMVSSSDAYMCNLQATIWFDSEITIDGGGIIKFWMWREWSISDRTYEAHAAQSSSCAYVFSII